MEKCSIFTSQHQETVAKSIAQGEKVQIRKFEFREWKYNISRKHKILPNMAIPVS